MARRRRLSPAALAALVAVAAAVVAAVAVFTPTDSYILLPDRAKPVTPLVEVEGGRPNRRGGIFYVDVLVRRATLLERTFPGIREGTSLVPDEVLNPEGLSERDRRRASLREMRRSQRVAAAVALRELGRRVRARPTGALIVEVADDGAAAGQLRPGDVVVAVDGQRVLRPGDLRRLIGRRPPGSALRVALRRESERREVVLRTRASEERPRRSVIGVFVDQAADIDLPLDVEIDAGNIGGPSAGLAFALEVLEQLGRDVDRGRRVAVTGAIELDGSVTAVGGIRQKTIGARRTGVDIFLVPAGDNAREAKRYGRGLRVVAVRNFQQALRALATGSQPAK